MTQGEHPRLPGELFESTQEVPTTQLMKDLQQHFADLRPLPFRHGKTLAQLPHDIMEASHVFVRVDKVTPPLVPPYEGPYEVAAKHP